VAAASGAPHGNPLIRSRVDYRDFRVIVQADIDAIGLRVDGDTLGRVPTSIVAVTLGGAQTEGVAGGVNVENGVEVGNRVAVGRTVGDAVGVLVKAAVGTGAEASGLIRLYAV